MDDEDVIRFSDPVLSSVTRMYSDLDSEKTPRSLGKVSAKPIAEALCELEKQVQSLVHVKEVPRIDVAKIIVILPDNIHPDKQAIICLTFPGVTTTALHLRAGVVRDLGVDIQPRYLRHPAENSMSVSTRDTVHPALSWSCRQYSLQWNLAGTLWKLGTQLAM